jgi:lipopolysaccharide transport system ATP-binding protein
VKGLRTGIYLRDMMGTYVFTSFDTDLMERYREYEVRSPGHYISRAVIPRDFFNEGQYALGVNAGVFNITRFFQDMRALLINVQGFAAPGKQWAERRHGVVRPRLNWEIEKID